MIFILLILSVLYNLQCLWKSLMNSKAFSVENLTTCVYFALINLQTGILCKHMGVSMLWSEVQSPYLALRWLIHPHGTVQATLSSVTNSIATLA